MSTKEALRLINGTALPEIGSAIDQARSVITAANDIEVELAAGSISSSHYAKIYTGRLNRMISKGINIPTGYVETLHSFKSHQEALLSGGYIKADENIISYWLDDGVIIGCIITQDRRN